MDVDGDLDLRGVLRVPASAVLDLVGTLFLRPTAVLENLGSMTVGGCSREAGSVVTGSDPCS